MNNEELIGVYTELGDALRDPQKRTEDANLQLIREMLQVFGEKMESIDNNLNVINAILRCLVNFVADIDSNRIVILEPETLSLVLRLLISTKGSRGCKKTTLLIVYLLDNLTIDNTFGIEKIASVRLEKKSFFTAILDVEGQLVLEADLDTVDELCEDLMERAAQFPNIVNLSDLVILECESFLKQISYLTAGNAVRIDVSPKHLYRDLLNGKDSLSKFTILGNLSANAECSAYDTSDVLIDFIGKPPTSKPLLLSAAFISLGNCITSKESRSMAIRQLSEKMGLSYVSKVLKALAACTQTAEFKYVCYQGISLITKLLPDPEFAGLVSENDNFSVFSSIIQQCLCDPVFLNYYTDIVKVVIKCILQFVDNLSDTRSITTSSEKWRFIKALQSVSEPLPIKLEVDIAVLRFATKMAQCQDTDRLTELWDELPLIKAEGVSYEYLCERVKTVGVVLSCSQLEQQLWLVKHKSFQEEFQLITNVFHGQNEMTLLKNNVKFVAARIMAINNDYPGLFDEAFVQKCREVLK